MNKEKIFENLLNEDGLFKPFAGFALTMAALTAIGIQAKNFDEKCKTIADELGVKLDENAFDQRGAAYYMPYLQSFKYDGGSKDYGMTPEGLCKYIRKTADVDNVEYKTVEGGVKISFVDRYSVNIGNVIHRREARGSFTVPNDYFNVSFTFQESKNKKSFFEELGVKLNEKRIELSSPYPVKNVDVVDYIERSSRLVYTATDDKTIQLYIYSNGSERPEAFAEVEITSVGYILHGAEGYDYQGNSLKEFEDDLKNIIFHFDAIMSKRFGENKEQLFDSILNEADDTYKAKVGGKWLKGNKLVKDKKDADTFESKTEPTQRINQMKKDGKINKNAKPSVVKESLQFFESLLQVE